jgi:hypothetical protein
MSDRRDLCSITLQMGEVTLKVHKRPQKPATDAKAEAETSSNGKHEPSARPDAEGRSSSRRDTADSSRTAEAAAAFAEGDGTDKRSSKRRDSSRSRSADRDGKRSRSGRDREKVIAIHMRSLLHYLLVIWQEL